MIKEELNLNNTNKKITCKIITKIVESFSKKVRELNSFVWLCVWDVAREWVLFENVNKIMQK